MIIIIILVAGAPSTVPASVPVIDVTDLYTPYQDPGDNFDLVTAFAMPGINLQAVIIDPTTSFLGTRAPGQLAVEQLNLAFGRNVPYAYGPFTALSSPTDTLSTAPANQQAGINLLLNTLQQSSQPVDIMSFGSARTIAAAYNRDPTLMEQKVGMIYLSAGSQLTGSPPYVEWNVNLDMNAYQCLLQSNLPITLMPCATGTSASAVGEYNTYYSLPNMNFINSMDPVLQRYVAYQFNQTSTSAFLPAMTQPVTGSMMGFTSQSHNVWETQAWMEASGQELVQHSNGTYAMIPPSQQQAGDTVLPNLSIPVNITYTGNGQYTFTLTSGTTTKWQYDRGSNPLQNQAAFQQALPALYDSYSVNSANLNRLSTVPVTNASFESQSLASGQSTSVVASGSGALAGWQAQGLGAGQDAGVLHPSTSMFASVPDGSNVLYASANSAAGSTSNVSIVQVTSTPVQANTKYVLSALVGARLDVPCAGYDIQLLAGGTVLAEDDNSFPITAGKFISTLVTYTAGAIPPSGDLEIRLTGLNGAGTGNQTDFASVDLESILPALVSANAYTWSNSGTTWGSAANWGGTAPGSADIGLFSSNTAYTSQPTLTGTAAVGGLWSTGSAALVVSGSALTLSGVVINGNAATGIEMDAGAGSLTITAPLVLAGSQTWLNSSGSLLTVSGNVANGGNLLTVAGNGNAIISGILSGSGGLTKAGGGVLTLSASNIYTGGTTISGGVLSITGTSSLPGWSTSGSYTVANGAALAVGNAVTDANIAAILATGNFAAYAGLGFDTTAGARTYAGVIADNANGPLGLFKIGANTLTLTGSNTFTGGVNLAAGTLNFSSNALNGLNNAITFSGGTLQWAAGNTQDISSKINISSNTQTAWLDTNGNNVTLATAIGGAGGLTKLGGGNLVLTASNRYTGLTTISAGTLTAGYTVSGANYSTFSAAGGGIAIGPNGTLVAPYTGALFGYWASGNWATITNAGLMYDSANANVNLGPVTLSGGTMAATGTGDNWGTWNLNNTVTVTQSSLISAANVDLAGNQPAGQRTFTVNPGATLNVTGYFRNGRGAVYGIILNGGGTMLLSGGNTYTGGTTISGAMLQLANSAALPASGTVTVNSGGILAVDAGAGNGLFTNATSGAGSIGYVLGTETWNPGSVFGIDTTYATGGTFTYSGSISGNEGLIKLGPGELILSGSDTFDGGTTVEAGTLIATNSNAIPRETSLTVGPGGIFVFDPSQAGAGAVPAPGAQAVVAAVPEPGTVALLVAAGIVAAAVARRTRRSFLIIE